MNRMNKIAFLCAILTASGCTANYKMVPESKQPRFSKDIALDYLVKDARKAAGISVDGKTLLNSKKYSDIKGKKVFSKDNQNLGKVFDILLGDHGEIILIISSDKGIPTFDLGDTKRAIYAHNAYFSNDKKSISLVITKDSFRKEPIVKESFFSKK